MNWSRLTIAFLVTCTLTQISWGRDKTPRQMAIERHLIATYATGFAGLNFGDGHGKIRDQLFEADINQHLEFRLPRKLGPIPIGAHFFKINPRVRVRMLTKGSFPVRTPSFMPNATIFFAYDGSQKTDNSFTYYSIMLSHHSNGQEGNFYNAAGDSINTVSGSFGTNFFEFGINRIFDKAGLVQGWLRPSLIWHPGFNREDSLKSQYEEIKIALTGSTIRGKLPRLGGPYLELEFYGHYVLKGLDYTFIPRAGTSALAAIKATWKDRLSYGFGLSFRLKERGDFRWFIKGDFGYDYYNINFWRKLRRFQFGIVGDPF